MASHATAMVFDGPGRPFRREEMPFPELKSGEVLARVEHCTICGSDLHSWRGRRSVPTPTLLGHEIIGVVDRLSPNGIALDCAGEPLRVGDRITWSIAISCRKCFFCLRNLPQKCESLRKYGHERIAPGFALNGGLSTHCHLLSGTEIARLPTHLPSEILCPVSCATSTVAAILRHAMPLAGKSLLIQGAGMLGLTACAMARAMGAGLIVAIDVEHKRLERARQFGADHAIEVGREDEAKRSTQHGFDVVVELSGSPGAMRAGLEVLRTGGLYLWAGAVFPTEAISVVPEQIVRRHLTIQGIHNYRPDDLVAAVAFLEEHHSNFPFAQVVEKTYGLSETEAAFEHADCHRPARVMIVPDID